jgi:hypothetical protein
MSRKVKWIVAFCLLLVLHAGTSVAQVKFEREYRIKPEEVPAAALEFIDPIFENTRIRWYLEISREGRSIEAKFNHNRTRYSIEFDESGNLLDVEFEIKEEAIPLKTKEKISGFLDNRFSRYRIMRIQQQWKGPDAEIKELLAGKRDPEDYPAKYEIKVRGREGKKTNWYEYLFSGEGEMISEIPVIFRNSDNLDY